MDSFEFGKDYPIDSPSEDSYYHEYCRLYLANVALTSQVRSLIDEKNQLISRLGKYEEEDVNSSCERANEKNKRMRRNADQIQRYYKCTIKSCGKSYGSEGSLNQHYKLKHPEIYAALPNVQCSFSEDESKENRKRTQPKGF